MSKKVDWAPPCRVAPGFWYSFNTGKRKVTFREAKSAWMTESEVEIHFSVKWPGWSSRVYE